jgi:FecR-like protein
MKRIFAKTFRSIAITLSLILLFFPVVKPAAAPLQDATVSQVIQDVRLLEAHAAPRRAVVNDKVTAGRAVRTGVESRAELTFTDLTITRLGANTIFSLAEGARDINLKNGEILVQVPRGAAPVTISTAAVTAGISGGTALLGTGPPLKFLVLEGTGTIYPKGHPEKAVTVQGGEMVLMTADGNITQPQQFDVRLVLETSALIIDFPPLTNLPLILAVMNQQLAEQLLAGTTSQPLSKNLIDVTSQSANSNPVVLASLASPTPPPPTPPPPTPPPPTPPPPTPPPPTPPPPTPPPPTPPPPTPTPSKFGPPSVIASPVPYLITSGTVITTDPSITTNGVTDFGKIYRGPTDDGAFTLWAFGSTSAFDTTVGVDNFFSNPNNLPIAVFKFQSLSLVGNPTIDLSNGGVTKLGLIGVDGITSGPPGGTLTFTGLDTLALGTVNGSINLTSDISFDGINALYIYARGAGSTPTLASPILNSARVELDAEGSMQLMVGITAAERLKFVAGGDVVTTAGSGQFTVDNIGRTINTGSITFQVGGSINALGSLNTTLDNTGGIIGTDASVIVTSSGAITVQGDAIFQISNSDNGTGGPPGQIGGNAIIDVTTGGGFSANSLTAIIDDRRGGSIGSSALLGVNIGGALSITTDAFMGISTRNDGTGGGTIGSDATMSLSAGSISVGGAFTTFVSANAGGSIAGNAINQVSVTGDLIVQGPIFADVEATGFNQINPINFIAGGHIGGEANVTLAAQNIITSSTATGIPGIDTMALQAAIFTNGQGTVGGNAIVNVIAPQNISAPGTVFFAVGNGNYQGFGPGTIGGDAQVNVTAGSLSTGALFDDIYNYGGGSIGRDAIISLNLSNNFTATGNAEFLILSFGGNITRNASINVTAGDFSAPSLTGAIDNSSGGLIGGNALINFGLSGNLNIAGDASFQINDNAGTIGGDAVIDVSAANISANSLSAQINDTDGSIGGNTIINVNVFGDLNTAGAVSLLLENYNETANPAGHIGGSANISLATEGNLTADSISAIINNRNGGTIGSSASLIFNVGGALTTLENGTDYFGGPSSLSLTISNRYEDTLGSTISGDATLALHADSANIGGDLSAFTSNRGGTIGGNALVNFNVTHDATVTGLADFEILNDGGPNALTPVAGTLHGSATVQVSAANLTVGGVDGLFLLIQNANGGLIDSNATLSFNLSGNLTTTVDADFQIQNQRSFGFAGPAGGSIGGDATMSITADNFLIGGGLDLEIRNRNSGSGSGTGGSIAGNAAISLAFTGDISAQGPAFFSIFNENLVAGSPGGSIGGDATVDVSLGNITSGPNADFHALVAQIDNRGGSIGGNATIIFGASGNVNAQGNALFQIYSHNDGTSGPGSIGGNATISVGAADISTAGFFYSAIASSGGGFIGGAATINLGANNITASSLFDGIYNSGGSIGGSASVNVDFPFAGNLTTTSGSAEFSIFNNNDGSGSGGGTIAVDAVVNVNAGNITTAPNGVDFNALVAQVDNRGGNIGNNAFVGLNASGDVNAQGNAFLQILNDNDGASGPGTIGGDAILDVSAANFSTAGLLHCAIDNSSGGSITGNANLGFSLSGDLTIQGDAAFVIANGNLGTIGGAATMNVAASNITANSLLAQIDNSNGGSIGATTEGGATISMNVSGSASITNDATLAIYGSDGAASAAINVNGGSYDVGGTFLSYIDGNGTITFNNATAHADILKAGVFGANGVLNVGGGGTRTLSADTTLQLYAPGSNGQLNFVSNVTLGGAGTKILAANSVTIFNGVVVTVSGSIANVYTNNPNYSVVYGGNGSTTGTFAGAGATTNSLSGAPPFDDPPPPATVTTTASSTTTTTAKAPTLSTTSGATTTTVKSPTLSTTSSTTSTKIASTTLSSPKTTSTKTVDSTINVSNTDQLLSLLDGATADHDGKIRISGSKNTSSNSGNTSRVSANGALKADRHAMDIRHMRDRSAIDSRVVSGKRLL